MEVASEAQYWRTNLCERITLWRRAGVSRSDGVYRMITKQILHSSHVLHFNPQRNDTGPNNSHVVTGSVFCNLRGKNTTVIREKCMSSCLFYRLIPLLCCYSKNHGDGQPSRPRPSPRKQPPSPRVTESDSVQFTDGDYVIM